MSAFLPIIVPTVILAILSAVYALAVIAMERVIDRRERLARLESTVAALVAEAWEARS